MGTIRIMGYAERKVNADIVDYYINFFSCERKASEALKNSNEQCELFLKELKKCGFDMSQIHLSEDRVDEPRYDDNRVDAEREIHFRSTFDPAFNNVISEIIHKNDLGVNINTDYSYSKKRELHEELLKEAVQNSKAKAELIAETTGQKVKYIDSVSDDRFDDSYYEETSHYFAAPMKGKEPSNDVFNELAGKELTESESIYVTWNID
ncbi:MAG: SIMPL domain-containing protein [Erysipelotrichaceae bacterium]|nr:SIMPL domain-containing protein [Erysipelotrichaceae bacterium]